MKQNTFILLLLVVTAFVVRVMVIWIGRPEFVGWFNHTYYYYVETEGLLTGGKLPFPDMPLLFYLYALTAKVCTYLGVNMHDAIVYSTRFWMSLIPSLIPLPVYAACRAMYKKASFPKWIWVFIFVGAFYPLSILHMPEFLQKNVLGLLLLAVFMQQSYRAIGDFQAKRIIPLLCIFVLLVFTHYGSTGAALLYAAAFFLSHLLHRRNATTMKLGLVIFGGLMIALTTYFLLDPQRFDRILFYLNRIFDTSSLGLIFSSPDADIFGALLMVMVPLGIVVLAYRLYRKAKPKLSYENSVFWLSNILFCYLLVLPIYDQLLFGRFANFLILPAIFVLVYTLQYAIEKSWIKKVIPALVVMGILTIAVGDITSRIRHNRNKEEVYQDLMKMKAQTGLSSHDLIITRNGAEHISNWFLDTKSCVITAFNLADFKKYDRIFILNPTEGSMRLRGNSTRAIEKYNYMLSNIQEPAEAVVVYESPHLRLLVLSSAPEAWNFDEKGNWISYDRE